ncbi:MAG: hypothetical protein HZC41_00940 [Chloroflexi bacterium]|nr:hypothetical protein [Chloroflexota bacterium]
MEPNTRTLSNRPPQRSLLIIAIIVIIAVIAAGVAIFLVSNTRTVTPGNYEGVPFSRQPDGGFLLGNPDARVTIIEFADYT